MCQFNFCGILNIMIPYIILNIIFICFHNICLNGKFIEIQQIILNMKSSIDLLYNLIIFPNSKIAVKWFQYTILQQDDLKHGKLDNNKSNLLKYNNF